MSQNISDFQEKLNNFLHKQCFTLLLHCNSAYQQQLLKQLAADRIYVDLRNPLAREQALWQPREWLGQQTQLCREQGFGLFVDNVQYAPQLLPFMQAARVTGLCVAAASQSCVLQDFLQGVQVLEFPLSFGDTESFVLPDCWAPDDTGREAWRYAHPAAVKIWQRIFSGGLAAAAFAGAVERERFYAEYLQNLLQRDIKELTNVSDELKFYRFLRAAAMAGGSVVNYANLAHAADITSPTAKNWLNILAGAGIVRFLEPVAGISGKRLAKAPKFYFADTGLAAYLLQLKDAQVLAASGYAASLWETYVFNFIWQSYLQALERPQLFYYRDSNAKEISLLLRRGRLLYPIEIKRDRSGLKACAKKLRLLETLAVEDLQLAAGTLLTPNEVLSFR